MSGLDTLIMFVLALMALGGARRASSPSSPSSPQSNAEAEAERARRALEQAAAAAQAAAEAAKASATPLPWPQALPAGLPPFPSGWEYAKPPSAAVKTRAWQLLSELWKQGAGSTRTELTEGNWITYRAEITAGGKRGVVAYRPKKGAKPAPARAAKPAPTSSRSPGVPQAVPVRTSAPAASMPSPTAERPLLVQGAGMGALEHLAPWVRIVQRKLRLTPVDGKFGTNTRVAVETLQRKRTKTPDGKVGPLTWAQLDAIPDPNPEPALAWNVEVERAKLAS